MAWRPEVEALVGRPSQLPALALSFAADVVWWRIVDRDAAVDATSAPPRSRRCAALRSLRAAPDALPIRDASVAWLVVSFLGDRARPGPRQALAAELVRVLAPGGMLVAVDHNRPRRGGAALAAIVAPPRPPALTPTGAWRRLAYPTARELRGAGLAIESLRLAARERVQLIVARRASRAGA